MLKLVWSNEMKQSIWKDGIQKIVIPWFWLRFIPVPQHLPRLVQPRVSESSQRQFDSLAKRPQMKLVWDTHCHSNKASNTNNTLPKCLCIQNDGMQTILEQGYKLSAHKNYFVSLVALAVCPQHRHLSTAWRSPGMEYCLSLDNENVCFANCSSELSFCQRLGMSWCSEKCLALPMNSWPVHQTF